ncbi:hypothetical protein [Rothia sp. ZJ932]|uniref:hypothetical protein n=1 Tax=Rothia sp. ZJ932 TaxID=2810516 RepID=UPI001967E412|nr:hypothetical protein [Rothia sp. ZJ932]QRZ61539.1 hypothetical protein JR346_10065 [Rothia sp. ZJ932]
MSAVALVTGAGRSNSIGYAAVKTLADAGVEHICITYLHSYDDRAAGHPVDTANLVEFLPSDVGQWNNCPILYSNGGFGVR